MTERARRTPEKPYILDTHAKVTWANTVAPGQERPWRLGDHCWWTPTMLTRIDFMRAQFEESNGFPPSRLVIAKSEAKEFFDLAMECMANSPTLQISRRAMKAAAGQGRTVFLGMTVEFGEKTEVRAPRLDLQTPGR